MMKIQFTTRDYLWASLVTCLLVTSLTRFQHGYETACHRITEDLTYSCTLNHPKEEDEKYWHVPVFSNGKLSSIWHIERNVITDGHDHEKDRHLICSVPSPAGTSFHWGNFNPDPAKNQGKVHSMLNIEEDTLLFDFAHDIANVAQDHYKETLLVFAIIFVGHVLLSYTTFLLWFLILGYQKGT